MNKKRGVCVCVCVRERERERNADADRCSLCRVKNTRRKQSHKTSERWKINT